MSIYSSSAAGGGGGASFFFYYFLASFLSATGAEAAGADPDPPKLKKELMSFPWSAFANILGQ